jgi:hypothetical protein
MFLARIETSALRIHVADMIQLDNPGRVFNDSSFQPGIVEGLQIDLGLTLLGLVNHSCHALHILRITHHISE